MMTVIHLPNNAGFRVYAKGASEIILARCKYILGKNGEIRPYGKHDLDDTTRNVIEPMASDGLRTIGLAYKDYVYANAKENEVSLEKTCKSFMLQ